jgi:hypothetical protein
MTSVQIISAPWCKRCQTVKPEVARYCSLAGATLSVVEYEEMEAADKDTVKSLPTIRMKSGADPSWSVYTTDTLEAWKTDIVKLASITAPTTATDF